MERDCYTHDEVNLESLPMKKGYRMSMKNCLYDKALFATRVSNATNKDDSIIIQKHVFIFFGEKTLECSYFSRADFTENFFSHFLKKILTDMSSSYE